MTDDEWKEEFKKEIIEDIKLTLILGTYVLFAFLMFIQWLVFGY